MFIGSGRSLTLVTLSLIEPVFLLTFTRLFRLGRTFTLLLVLVRVTRTRLLVMITTRGRLMRLIRRFLVRGGLVPPLILIWRTTSNNVGPIDQRSSNQTHQPPSGGYHNQQSGPRNTNQNQKKGKGPAKSKQPGKIGRAHV